jgi:DnaJ-class molecular chaperone
MNIVETIEPTICPFCLLSRCPDCLGSGMSKSEQGAVCHPCSGTGRRIVWDAFFTPMVCGRCKGKERVDV